MLTKTYSKELANLAKLYTNKAKYNNENNNFNFKLITFIKRLIFLKRGITRPIPLYYIV
jgi:hypothetical protein